MKLYYGGFGDYAMFTAAENEKQAIENIQKQPGMGWLPVEVKELLEVDGFNVNLVDPKAPKINAPQEVKANARKPVSKKSPKRK